MKIYKSYMFRVKDPVIDETRTLVQDANGGERIRHRHLVKIEQDGGPSATSMRNWYFGKTKRPQSAAIEALGRALGYKRVWVKHDQAKK